MRQLAFTVPGDPVPKARPRVVRGRTYTPKRTVLYEMAVAYAATLAIRNIGDTRWNSDGRFKVTIDFWLGNARHCDLDNLSKAILDALTPKPGRGSVKPPGMFWRDDWQVDILVLQKSVCIPGQLPRAYVVVMEL